MPKLNIFITDGDYTGPITTIDVDEKTLRLTQQSSIERVINTSMRYVEQINEEDAEVNYQDWEEWKSPLVDVFNAIRNCAFTFPFKQSKYVR